MRKFDQLVSQLVSIVYGPLATVVTIDTSAVLLLTRPRIVLANI